MFGNGLPVPFCPFCHSSMNEGQHSKSLCLIHSTTEINAKFTREGNDSLYAASVCCKDFDGTAYLADIARAVQTALQEMGLEIPHMKLLAWEPEGDFGKIDLLGTERPIIITRYFEHPCTDIAVILNANAVCPAAGLDRIIWEAVKAASSRSQLDLTVFRKECFNLGE